MVFTAIKDGVKQGHIEYPIKVTNYTRQLVLIGGNINKTRNPASHTYYARLLEDGRSVYGAITISGGNGTGWASPTGSINNYSSGGDIPFTVSDRDIGTATIYVTWYQTTSNIKPTADTYKQNIPNKSASISVTVTYPQYTGGAGGIGSLPKHVLGAELPSYTYGTHIGNRWCDHLWGSHRYLGNRGDFYYIRAGTYWRYMVERGIFWVNEWWTTYGPFWYKNKGKWERYPGINNRKTVYYKDYDGKRFVMCCQFCTAFTKYRLEAKIAENKFNPVPNWATW